MRRECFICGDRFTGYRVPEEEAKTVSFPANKYYYVETYGCQMNFADSEIIGAIMRKEGYEPVEDIEKAGLVFINTCAIRDNAEQRVFRRLQEIRALKKSKPDLLLAVVGCMAEQSRLVFEEQKEWIDIVAGPDSYRNLHDLIHVAGIDNQAVNTVLSENETYSDIDPYRSEDGISAFVSVMRGCNNYCSYCVVPYTRGRERSRDPQSIIREIRILSAKGFREVTLLGQNVNSYKWNKGNTNIAFAEILDQVASVNPKIRIRYATSHPRDVHEDIIRVMAAHDNICKHLHLALQSGSNRILKRMNRQYSREDFMERIRMVREIIPDIGLSTDIICGFSGEREEDHQQTLSLMEEIRFDLAYMFAYSERKGTYAAEHLNDDVPPELKKRRLGEIIALQNTISLENNKQRKGKIYEVLVEGFSRRSDQDFKGRNSQNIMLVFPRQKEVKAGDYICVKVSDASSATLIGEIVNE
jgi:tRNA-2-methylthio-N6-dimethylallyladenosine synthase